MKRTWLLVLLISWHLSACAPAVPTPVCQPSTNTVTLAESSRSFYMGFTRWPPEATAVGIERMNRFIAEHGDLTALHFDGGIPWPEALQNENGPLSRWGNERMADSARVYPERAQVAGIDHSAQLGAQFPCSLLGQRKTFRQIT